MLLTPFTLFFRSRYLMLYALLAQFFSFSTSTGCFFPNGEVDESSKPCPSRGEYSSCCNPEDICLSNGLCFVKAQKTMRRQSCTDQDWGSSCPLDCFDHDLSTWADVQTCSVDDDNNSCCEDIFCCQVTSDVLGTSLDQGDLSDFWTFISTAFYPATIFFGSSSTTTSISDNYASSAQSSMSTFPSQLLYISSSIVASTSTSLADFSISASPADSSFPSLSIHQPTSNSSADFPPSSFSMNKSTPTFFPPQTTPATLIDFSASTLLTLKSTAAATTTTTATATASSTAIATPTSTPIAYPAHGRMSTSDRIAIAIGISFGIPTIIIAYLTYHVAKRKPTPIFDRSDSLSSRSNSFPNPK